MDNWIPVMFETLIFDTNEFFKENKIFNLKKSWIEYELFINRNLLINALYKNWLPKREIWKSLKKEERKKIKLDKQIEDFRRLGSKEV